MKFLIQPDYSASVLNIYSLSGASLITTIQLPHSGPNGAIMYQEPSSGGSVLFVSYAPSSGIGVVDVFDFNNVNLGNASNTPVPFSTLSLDDGAVGLAIQPGTKDLYVATLNLNGGNAGVGVYSFTYASSYKNSSKFQFSSYAGSTNSVDQLCANLAFDLHGFLWMTTFEAGLSGQFLICYTKVDRTASSDANFLKIANGNTSFTNTVKLPPSTTSAPHGMVPFSQPEGIAFDPAGNLWLGNNNDDYSTNGDGNGTLLKISQTWITKHLLNFASLNQTLTVNGYGGTRFISSNDPDVTVYYLNDAKFGGLSFDGFTLYAHDQNSGGDASNAVVWQFETDLALSASTFKPSGIPTTYPGNGGMAILDTAPAKLLIRDVPADTGAEPDVSVSGNFVWESPDIGVTQNSISASLPGPNSPPPAVAVDLASDSSINAGPSAPDAFVYVKVFNAGQTPTSGKEIIKLYWAKASAGLDWISPWDGLQFDSAGGAHPPLGGLIGVQKVGTIAAGNQTFFEFPWTSVPDASLYSETSPHFCLLARIETTSLYPFGMTFPEQVHGAVPGQAIIANAKNNSKIGWRNVTVTPVAAKIHYPISLGILGGNYSDCQHHFRFAVETLDREGNPAPITSRVVIRADGWALLRLLEARLVEGIFHILEEGHFLLSDWTGGMEGIRLGPKETLPFHVDFTPVEGVHDFAVRVVQYMESERGHQVVGGQTFIVGNVKGFPVRATAPHYK